MTIHLPKWLVGDDPHPEPSNLDRLDARIPSTDWFAQCTGEGHRYVSPYPAAISGPFDTEDEAAHAHHWHQDCTVKTFQKEES